ncbi:hypothetical protein GHT06_019549 [Daphnia sinensis]|uniref:Uncharacterized protein n=1 Tax=Daphnia sinensis TaxID=1820382 RepID=A0AAD5KK94_9CRUS|nr:hypothetical protein GHT06_019549 [Daphnia sinensis]
MTTHAGFGEFGSWNLVQILRYGFGTQNSKNMVLCEKWSYVTVFNGLFRETVNDQDLFIELNELSGQSEHLIAEFEKYSQRNNYTRRNPKPTEVWHSLLGNDFNDTRSPRINRQPKLNFFNKNFRKKEHQDLLRRSNPDDKLAYSVPAMFSR